MNDMNTKQNWVRARAACTLDNIFDDILGTMETDVRDFNSLSSEIRRDRLFGSELTQNRTFEVFHAYDDPNDGLIRTDSTDSVSVKKAPTFIMVIRGHDTLKITLQWNEETLSCDLLVKGKALSVSRISQRILGNFMFGV